MDEANEIFSESNSGQKEATQKTIDSLNEVKYERERDLRCFCLDLSNVPGVNDDGEAVIKRANMYYSFINSGVVI